MKGVTGRGLARESVAWVKRWLMDLGNMEGDQIVLNDLSRSPKIAMANSDRISPRYIYSSLLACAPPIETRLERVRHVIKFQ